LLELAEKLFLLRRALKVPENQVRTIKLHLGGISLGKTKRGYSNTKSKFKATYVVRLISAFSTLSTDFCINAMIISSLKRCV
jgi:hypothetical protein